MISHQEKREELEASQGQDYEKMMADEDFRPSDEEVRTKFLKIHLTMRAWPVARSIFDAPLVREANELYVREANERTTSWIRFTWSLILMYLSRSSRSVSES